MRTDTQRSDKYGAKTVPATVGLKIASVLPGMKSAFLTAITSLVPIELQIQAVLNGADVPTINYPFYLCFGRELWAAQNRGIDGLTITSVGQSLHDKWAVGLDTAVLVEIADTVFGITVT